MSVITVYRDYFKNLAVQHPQLQHDDTAGMRVFTEISLEQAQKDWREGIKSESFAMRLIIPTFNYSDAGADARKRLQGGFFISHKHSRGDSDEYLDALEKCESVGDDIVARMIYDSENGHELFNYSLSNVNEIEVVPTENSGSASYSGWLYAFLINPRFTKCIDPENPGSSIWNDL